MSGAAKASLKFGSRNALPKPGLDGSSWYMPPDSDCQPLPEA